MCLYNEKISDPHLLEKFHGRPRDYILFKFFIT